MRAGFSEEHANFDRWPRLMYLFSLPLGLSISISLSLAPQGLQRAFISLRSAAACGLSAL